VASFPDQDFITGFLLWKCLETICRFDPLSSPPGNCEIPFFFFSPVGLAGIQSSFFSYGLQRLFPCPPPNTTPPTQKKNNSWDFFCAPLAAQDFEAHPFETCRQGVFYWTGRPQPFFPLCIFSLLQSVFFFQKKLSFFSHTHPRTTFGLGTLFQFDFSDPGTVIFKRTMVSLCFWLQRGLPLNG